MIAPRCWITCPARRAPALAALRASAPDKRQVLPSYGLLDARLTLSDIPAGPVNLRLSAWGRNLTNKDYLVFEGAVGLSDRFGALFGEPRSYGLDLTASF